MNRPNLKSIKEDFPLHQMMLLWINRMGTDISDIGGPLEQTANSILEHAIALTRETAPRYSDLEQVESALSRLSKSNECDEEALVGLLSNEGIPSTCLQLVLQARSLHRIAHKWDCLNSGVKTLRTLQAKLLLPKVSILEEHCELEDSYDGLVQALFDSGYRTDQAKKCTQMCREMTNCLRKQG